MVDFFADSPIIYTHTGSRRIKNMSKGGSCDMQVNSSEETALVSPPELCTTTTTGGGNQP